MSDSFQVLCRHPFRTLCLLPFRTLCRHPFRTLCLLPFRTLCRHPFRTLCLLPFRTLCLLPFRTLCRHPFRTLCLLFFRTLCRHPFRTLCIIICLSSPPFCPPALQFLPPLLLWNFQSLNLKVEKKILFSNKPPDEKPSVCMCKEQKHKLAIYGLRRYAANDKIFKLFFLHPFLASTIYNNSIKNKFDIG